MNLIEPEIAKGLHTTNLKEIFEDIVYEFSKHVKVLTGFIINSNMSVVGAEPGAVFIELEDKFKTEILVWFIQFL